MTTKEIKKGQSDIFYFVTHIFTKEKFDFYKKYILDNQDESFAADIGLFLKSVVEEDEDEIEVITPFNNGIFFAIYKEENKKYGFIEVDFDKQEYSISENQLTKICINEKSTYDTVISVIVLNVKKLKPIVS